MMTFHSCQSLALVADIALLFLTGSSADARLSTVAHEQRCVSHVPGAISPYAT